VMMVCQYNYHSSGYYPLSCLSFKTTYQRLDCVSIFIAGAIQRKCVFLMMTLFLIILSVNECMHSEVRHHMYGDSKCGKC
jgi:hypothetical protein